MRYICILILLIMLSGCAYPNAQETHPLLYPLHFFKSYLSDADGDRCPMYPSCSTYSTESFKKHGLFMGWIMSCDRLMRCGRDELKTCPPIRINSEKLCYDPVNNNDFWW